MSIEIDYFLSKDHRYVFIYFATKNIKRNRRNAINYCVKHFNHSTVVLTLTDIDFVVVVLCY